MNQATENGRTPLIFAAYEGHAAVVAALLAAGAAVNRKTQWGDTALTQAQGEEVTDVLADHVAFIASVAADPGVLVRGFVVALHFGAAAGGAGAASATHEAPPPHCTIKAPLRWAPPAARAAVLALAQDMAASQLAAALCLCLAASRTTAGHSLVEVLGPDPASLVASFLQPSSPEARAAVRAMARLAPRVEAGAPRGRGAMWGCAGVCLGGAQEPQGGGARGCGAAWACTGLCLDHPRGVSHLWTRAPCCLSHLCCFSSRCPPPCELPAG